MTGAAVTRRLVGSVAEDGVPTDVHAFTLRDPGGTSVEVWTYGATLVSFVLPGAGGERVDVVTSLPDLAAYAAHDTYVGATMGRFGRIVRGGRFVLDGTVHRLGTDATGHHVHGGARGFARRVWAGEGGQLDGRAAAWLSLHSPDGEEGYPGAVDAQARFVLGPGARLGVTLTARADAPTVVGLVSHVFWNLAGRGPIDGHHLTLGSRHALASADMLPLPDPVRPAEEVLGLPLDAPVDLTGRRIDDFVLLDRPGPAARLVHPPTGRRLLVETDQSGMGVYTGDGLTPPRAGVCLQPGAWPDAPNRPDFPPVRLDPGATATVSSVWWLDHGPPGAPGET